MRNVKIKKNLAGMLGGVILIFTLLGTFEFHKSVDKTISIFKSAFVFHSRAILEVNDFVKNSSSVKNAGKTSQNNVPFNRRENNKKRISFLFLMLGAVLISNDKNLLIIMFKALMCGLKNFQTILDINGKILSEVMFYLRRSLKFLTPIQKCISARADEYDINPMKMILWGNMPLYLSPYFRKLFKVRVFFMDENN